ncbi:MAG: hypothetical protein JSW40_04085, partial [Candidatus Omnitrophota bacterium]
SAILHHREVTYSITCSLTDLKLPPGVKESYRTLCSFLVHFYSQLGLPVQFAKDASDRKTEEKSILCFNSHEPFDLVINGKKIGGNAQRRRRNLLFQHGSIPQEIDFELVKRTFVNSGGCENALCLDTILGRQTDFYQLCTILYESFRDIFGVKFIKHNLYEREINSFYHLVKDKYATSRWNKKEFAVK